MELGAEISQKIRSAIKAKLVDLGAYVDDELPDYIMVMVANKKNVAQMTADLNLFLGNNTEKFTVWLSGLLNKLQAVTTENENNEAVVIEEEDIKPILHVDSSVLHAGDPELTLNAEFDEKFEEEPPKVVEKPKEIVKPTMKVVSSKTSSSSRARTTTTTSSSSSQSGSRRRSSGGGEEEASSRKRRLASSAVIVRREASDHEEEEEEEEEYDPLNPAVGKVASVIRVTERKSSIPVTKQANKSLLMRAMKDAESSVSKVKVVRPMRNSGSADDNDNKVEERRTITASSRSSSGSSSRKRPIELFSRSKREQMRRHVAAAITGSDSRDSRHVSRSNKSQSKVSKHHHHQHSTDAPPLPVRQTVEVLPIMEAVRSPGEHEEAGAVMVGGEEEEQEEHFELVMDPELHDWQDDEEDELMQNSLHHMAASAKDRAPSPKFVVTLDGVDADNLSLGGDDEEEELMGGRRLQEDRQNVVRVQPMRPVQPVMVRLEEEDGDSAEEEEDLENDAKKAKLTEKCHFYPNCKNGEECPYSHPTTPCMNFPNCRFGDRCVYLHPKCKFDATCSRPNCSYTHSSKKPAMPMPVIMPVPMYPPAPRPPKKEPTLPTCRFFPNCTNLNCTFNHPKPCRFGMSCSRKSSCTFTHPALPAKDKLKWTPASAKMSPPKPVTPTSPISP